MVGLGGGGGGAGGNSNRKRNHLHFLPIRNCFCGLSGGLKGGEKEVISGREDCIKGEDTWNRGQKRKAVETKSPGA